MELWSVQHKNAYDIMIQTGTLRADDDRLLFDGEFREKYRWMAEQMTRRIGPSPDPQIKYPVWAWYQWDSKHKRIDMRTHGWYAAEEGEPIVLLSLEVPDEEVLLSDFDYWHVVLSDYQICVEEEDWEREFTEEEKRKTWEYIFDVDCTFEKKQSENTLFYTQACMWEIKKEWVKKAEFFVSRGNTQPQKYN